MASETHEAASQAAHHGAEAAGMPQLDFATFPNQIFWLLITLVVIYFVLSRVVLPRVSSVLSERQGTITNDISVAEELKIKAQEAEAAYNKALIDARAEAQKIAAEAKAEIKTKLDVAISKADAEIAAKAAEAEKEIAEIRKGAMESVKKVAGTVTKDIVASMGIKADAKSVNAAVNARLKG
ncbi:MAG: ATP F0F1 synthase subunit B' [Rhodobacterales bacterium]|nr:MAG: ATP F0F1 synthase subunit B' [Rhodobacterales bacterium]